MGHQCTSLQYNRPTTSGVGETACFTSSASSYIIMYGDVLLVGLGVFGWEGRGIELLHKFTRYLAMSK